MTSILAFTPTLNLDAPRNRARPCPNGAPVNRRTEQPRTGSASIATTGRFRWFRSSLRSVGALVRFEPSLSEKTLDQTGVAEFLRRR